MKLIIDSKIISEPIINIIYKLKEETKNNYFDVIEDKGNYVRCTCPFHANGHEKHPSFSVFSDESDNSIIYGTWHCFTCGEKGSLISLVEHCLNCDTNYAKQWLKDNFSSAFIEKDLFEEEIKVSKDNNFIDESVLLKYNNKHPYMYERKLSDDVINKFKVGFDKDTNELTFPVWDENSNLVMITRRSVINKFFKLGSNINKPVYLLNFIKRENIKSVIVCEGQIDALVAWSYGYPAVALFGASTSDYQLDILNKSGITNYILMYDNDLAGRHGAKRFKSKINKNCFVTDIIMPANKDVADCTKEEFLNILKNSEVV